MLFLVLFGFQSLRLKGFYVDGFPDPYTDFGISDWLINYEGGFVRRGLCGQLLFWAYQLHPYDVHTFIYWMCIVTSVIMVVTLAIWFKRQGWSWMLLPASCFLFLTLFNIHARRDYLMLGLMALTIWLYGRYIKARQRWALISFILVSILMALVHESSFFFVFPILFCYDIAKRRRIGDSLLAFAPMFSVICCVSIYNGGGIPLTLFGTRGQIALNVTPMARLT